MKPRAILIDGMHLCYRHFYTRKNDKNSYQGDVFVGFYHGFFNTIRFMRSRYPAYSIYVLWDSHTRKRYAIKPDYKKKPSKNVEAEKQKLDDREQLAELLPELKEMLTADGIHQCIADGYEADDIAGFMVEQLLEDNKDIILWTGDQDWAQLIQEKVRWVNSNKNNLVFDAKSFELAYGYPPEGIPVFKCLTGDKSDNIKGIFKFPKKVAAQLASRTTSVEGFFYDRAILNDVSEKWKIEIKDNVGELRTNFQLVTLYKNINNVKFTEGNHDKEKIESFFDKYGLRSETRSKLDEFYRRRTKELEEEKEKAQADSSV